MSLISENVSLFTTNGTELITTPDKLSSTTESPHRPHLHVVGCCSLSFWLKPTKLAHTLSSCSCVCFCLYGPFSCITFHKFLWQLSAFSLYSFGLIPTLLVLSSTYLFMKVSFSPDIILCGWLGSKHKLTNSTIWQRGQSLTLNLTHRSQGLPQGIACLLWGWLGAIDGGGGARVGWGRGRSERGHGWKPRSQHGLLVGRHGVGVTLKKKGKKNAKV